MLIQMPKKRRIAILNRDKVRELRESMGLTQDQAAKRAKLAGGRARWGDIESGRRANITLETLALIADALQCDAATLLI